MFTSVREWCSLILEGLTQVPKQVRVNQGSLGLDRVWNVRLHARINYLLPGLDKKRESSQRNSLYS